MKSPFGSIYGEVEVYVQEVLAVTILEKLGDEVEVLLKAKHYMGLKTIDTSIDVENGWGRTKNLQILKEEQIKWSCFIMDFVIEFIFNAFVGTFEMFFSSRIDKHIASLKQESWFKELISENKYADIIANNRKVRNVLLRKRNLERLNKDEKFRNRFIELIKVHQHNK